MGLMSMCPACGSDWCTGCECVKKKYEPLLALAKELANKGCLCGDDCPKGHRCLECRARKILKDIGQ